MSLRELGLRGVQSVMLLFVVMVVVFLSLHLVPSDPVEMLLAGRGTRDDVDNLRERLGFDKPLYVQFLRYIAGALRGDLGESVRIRRPVVEMILERLPSTIQLTFSAFILASTVGVVLGIFCAVWKDTAFDDVVRAVALMAQSMPAYWLGLLLIMLMAVRLGLFPTGGKGGLSHIILPSITLATYMVGFIVRLTRSEMLEALSQDYVRTAHSKGLPQRLVVFRHVLKNAMLPVITVMGLQVGTLLGGAVITETVFAWPGIGSLAIVALNQRDYPVVQGVVLVTASMFLFVNFAVDALYVIIDPRIKGI